MIEPSQSVWLLIQPFLSLLPPTDLYYQACMRAAGEVCQTHKRLHQSLDYGHSFIAVQSVFVSGITLLYALWTHQRAVWSVTLSNDIRACSLVLFVMGERAPWVRKYRDAFELLVNATMEKLESGYSNLAETAAANCGMTPLPGGGGGTQNGGDMHGQNGPGGGVSSGAGGGGSGVGVDNVMGLNDGQGVEHLPGSEDAWRVVAELTSWIDQSNGSPVWMPDFESLQNLQPWQ